MSTVVVEQGPDEVRPPPRRGPAVLVLAALVVTLLAVFGRHSEDLPADAVDRALAATTTTTVPAARNVGILAGQTRIDSEAFLLGPEITWSEWQLPEEVSGIYAVGEFGGRPALIASTSPPNARGLLAGAALILGDGEGGWDDPLWSVPADEQVVSADIGPQGFIVVTAGDGAALLPYQPTEVTVHSSPDGTEWGTTRLTEEGEGWLVNIDATVGSRPSVSWVTAIRIADDYPAVTAALPDSIRALVQRGTASVVVRDGSVTVELPIGFPILRTDLGALGLTEEAADPAAVRRSGAAWVSTDQLTFEPVPQSPTGDEFVVSMTRGVDGRMLIVDTSSSILQSEDGLEWEPVAELSHLGFGAAGVQSIAGKLLSIHPRVIEIKLGGSGQLVLVPPMGRGISPYVEPAGGAGGLAVVTAAGGPEYSVRVRPTDVVRDGRLIRVEPAEHRIQVYEGGALVDEFVSPDDDHRVVFDQETSRIHLGGPPGESDVWITVDELERSLLGGLSLNTRGPYGIAYTRDAERWGWAPLVDEAGDPAGPVARLGLGEDVVFAVVGEPAVPNSPLAGPAPNPRLLVGSVGP